MEEFLKREAMTGKLLDPKTNQPMMPPGNRVEWDGAGGQRQELFEYLRTVGHVRNWNPKECMVAFPATSNPEDIEVLQNTMDDIKNEKYGPLPQPADYEGKPVNVDAPAVDRMKEALASRTELCIYDEEMQNAPLVHFMCTPKEKARLLVHFYSFIFFQDWKQDMWTKRFVRDHIRYRDELMCAAARIVDAVRNRAKAKNPESNPQGVFDAFHIRRGDFQYKKTRVDADVIYEISKNELEEGATVYIGTDERNKPFFKPLADHYDVCYLDDFMHLIKGLNSNYYGMLDQLIASRSRAFYGTWFSSFSGYINRMRGYYSTKNKLDGYEDGIVKSWYFAPAEKKYEMQKYWPSRLPFYMREFPPSWRNIDKGINELNQDIE